MYKVETDHELIQRARKHLKENNYNYKFWRVTTGILNSRCNYALSDNQRYVLEHFCKPYPFR